jgi:hypothetical protein
LKTVGATSQSVSQFSVGDSHRKFVVEEELEVDLFVVEEELEFDL